MCCLADHPKNIQTPDIDFDYFFFLLVGAGYFSSGGPDRSIAKAMLVDCTCKDG